MGMALKRVFEFAFYDVFMFQANYSLQQRNGFLLFWTFNDCRLLKATTMVT